MCDGPWDDIKAKNMAQPRESVSMAGLADLGVKHWHIPSETFEYPVKALPFDADAHTKVDPTLKALRAEWGMNYADIITITPEHMPGYEEKLKMFFEEHIHDDDEIRYILGGSGYFDVRDGQERWVRIHCKAGDLITLPEGIYHRFTLDSNEYVQAMRLFIGNPVWTALNRPQDEHPKRRKYVEKYVAKSDSRKASWFTKIFPCCGLTGFMKLMPPLSKDT